MAIDTIKFKRGVKSKLNNLSYGEPAYISDENELYIGTEDGVEKITRNKEVAELSSQLEHIAKHADIPTYNLGHITDDMGVTRGIQSVLDEISNTGIGRILLDRVYEIDEPLVIDRQNQNTNTSIEFYGGGCVKKSANFKGDQLVLLKIGFHDEDNIIFNNISFDGVDRTVNGIDTFENLNYNEECSDKSQRNESKFVKFYHCSFNNCYHGVRLSSLSWVFSGCLFEYNNYGVYLDCSANANTFLGCSIRRNIIGVKIKQFDATIGTVSNGFYNCTIESNQNLGIISKCSRNTKITGNYFEDNGHNIDANFEHSNNRKVHILMQDSGGAGQHTFDNFYNASDFDIVGILSHSIIINPCKVELQLATNTTFINNLISNIKFIGFGAYTSDFYLNNERYLSTADTKVLYKPNEVIASDISTVDKKYYLNQTSNISSNSIDFCTLKINPIGIGMIININAILEGRTSAGNPVSCGAIKGSVIISKSTNNTEQYVAHVDDLKLINCNGALSGSGSTTNKLFSTSANITTTSNSNTITLKINGIDTSSMINWGPPVKVNKIIS